MGERAYGARPAGGGGGPAKRRGAQAIGDLLAGFMAANQVGRAIARETLEAAWRDAVGAEVAGMTRVRGLRDGVLTVEVNASGLLQELSTFYKGSILAALKRPEVREISFRLGAWTTP
ncbi:MAG TPA: DUF721 domain-containing protein [Planctomycetota bacterium]|nr:DUF721 domain-containing protein [Planctomycetota bacterium]